MPSLSADFLFISSKTFLSSSGKFFLKLYGREYKNKTKSRLLLEVLTQVIVIGILSYLGRNIVELVPSPFNGISGFKHLETKEIKNGAYLTVFLFMFQYSLQDKLLYIKNSA